VYTIIRKRTIFHQLANLATDHTSIAKALTKRSKRSMQSGGGVDELPSMEGSVPASEAEPGTLKATLAATPGETHTRFVCNAADYQSCSCYDLIIPMMISTFITYWDSLVFSDVHSSNYPSSPPEKN